MLNTLEKEETSYWENYLPDVVVSHYNKKKEKTETREVKKEDYRLDRGDRLNNYLDNQKIEYDDRYGIKTVKNNQCLYCCKREISIVRCE